MLAFRALLAALAALSQLAPVPTEEAPSPAAPTTGPGWSAGIALDELVAFGASRIDAGNVFIASGGFLAAPPYHDGRFTDGPTWVDRLATSLGLAEPGPSFAGGSNYAVGGAGLGPGLSSACLNGACSPNVGLQIEQYLATGPTIDGDELFVLQGGGNNLANFTGLSNSMVAAAYMRDHIEALVLAGAQQVLVMNLDVPLPTGLPTEPSNTAWTLRYNAALSIHVALLEAQYGVPIVLVDQYGLSSAIRANPAAYGMTNLTDPACPECDGGFTGPTAAATVVPNPDEHYYWDPQHPTTAHHALVAERALATLDQELGLGLGY